MKKILLIITVIAFLNFFVFVCVKLFVKDYKKEFDQIIKEQKVYVDPFLYKKGYKNIEYTGYNRDKCFFKSITCSKTGRLEFSAYKNGVRVYGILCDVTIPSKMFVQINFDHRGAFE